MRTKKTGAVAGLVLATLAAALTPSTASAVLAPASGGVTKVATAAPVVVRQVRLNVPRTAEVGANLSGYAQVVDIDGGLALPVPGVKVVIQMQRPGAGFVSVSNDTTDQSGMVTFAFTARTNVTWRAVMQTSRRTLVSKQVTTTATAQANWGGRPDMDVTHGARAHYAVRVLPAGGKVLLQYAAARSGHLAWVSAQPVAVPQSGLVDPYVKFPKAGTYYLRAATARSAFNATGYTSTIAVTVH
jgi:hypothetical protein